MQAGTTKRVSNFSHDIRDSEAYAHLIKQIAPREAGADLAPLERGDPLDRAEGVLEQADKIECRWVGRRAARARACPTGLFFKRLQSATGLRGGGEKGKCDVSVWHF